MFDIEKIISLALREDQVRKDVTTLSLVPAGLKVRAGIISKQKGVLCGLAAARSVFRHLNRSIKFLPQLKDGDRLKRGQLVAYVTGDARAILSGERVALNFLARLSGISTITSAFVRAVKGYPANIMDTRKTTPLLRNLERYAVRCGGGVNHRLDLSRQILIKDNHISICRRHCVPGNKSKIQDIIVEARKKNKDKLEIEVKTLAEFKQALGARPDIIMLDNFSLADIKEAVAMRKAAAGARQGAPVKIEASGGITLDNVRAIAACGVERISLGALTHSAPSLDMSLDICSG